MGSEKLDDNVGPHSLGDRNERGERLIEWVQVNGFIVDNTWFKQPLRRRWTWKSLGDGSRNQIDCILIPKRFRNALLSTQTFTLPSADCYSDHVLVSRNFRLKLKRRKSQAQNIELNLALLKSDPDILGKFQIKVKNKFEALEQVNEIEEQGEQLRDSIKEAACEEIPKIERKPK